MQTGLPPLLVFDLDGTLVDTAADLMATLNALLVREGHRPLPFSAVGSLVGQGARVMLERGLRANGVEVEEAVLARLFDDFLEHYGANIAAESRPFPGVLDAMDRFAAAGWRMAVCTNKMESLSRRLIGELGLTDRFHAICGGDTFTVRKPDPAHLIGTIAMAGGDPRRSVMIGDSRADILAARNAGVPVVAVTFGYSDVPVADFAPDRIIDDFAALWEAVHGVVGTGAPISVAAIRQGSGAGPARD
jgi:phosphoglycolate phosphatase